MCVGHETSWAELAEAAPDVVPATHHSVVAAVGRVEGVVDPPENRVHSVLFGLVYCKNMEGDIITS